MGVSGVSNPAIEEPEEILLEDLLEKEVPSAFPQREPIPCSGNRRHNHTAHHNVQMTEKREVALDGEKRDHGQDRQERSDWPLCERSESQQDIKKECVLPMHFTPTIK